MKPETTSRTSAKSPFVGDVWLSNTPMDDAEFAEYVRIKNNEIPIEQVDFSYDLLA